MFGLPAPELAALQVDEAWDRELLQPVVPPGSQREADALAQLDQTRAEQLTELGDDSASRALRSRRYWGNHYRHARV